MREVNGAARPDEDVNRPKIGHEPSNVPTPPPGAVQIPCGIALPDALVPRARHALEALLVPLGLDPTWDETPEPGLWYGPPEADAPIGRLRVDATGWDRRVRNTAADPSDPVFEAWWWLSGDAEDEIVARDGVGRYAFSGSWHDRLGLGLRAPVDEARDRLAGRLRAAGMPVRPRRWAGRPWALCPTHDVDYVRRFRPGLAWRETVEHLVLDRRGLPAVERIRRWLRFAAAAIPSDDPYRRALRRMLDMETGLGVTATWFFKTAAHGPYDVGYRVGSAFVRRFLAAARERGHEIGLHPSFHSFAHPDRMVAERDTLASASGGPVPALRTHYLRWHDAVTPSLAGSAGFAVDSSLGFADSVGFRRGTCVPFRLWDRANDRAASAWEIPLSVMESSLFNRMGLDVEGAMEATQAAAGTARRHGGALVVLWHNVLWEEDDAPGWGEHFERTLRWAVSDGASVASLGSALSSWAPGPA